MPQDEQSSFKKTMRERIETAKHHLDCAYQEADLILGEDPPFTEELLNAWCVVDLIKKIPEVK